MSSERCPLCNGEGWVCENHPDVPFVTGLECCGGAGMPCVCNTSDPPWHHMEPIAKASRQ